MDDVKDVDVEMEKERIDKENDQFPEGDQNDNPQSEDVDEEDIEVKTKKSTKKKSTSKKSVPEKSVSEVLETSEVPEAPKIHLAKYLLNTSYGRGTKVMLLSNLGSEMHTSDEWGKLVQEELVRRVT